ncbi:MAG: hypothetical protein IPI50_10485 [Saprospiraceae bacterium]|nr:hypothetical protein [Saprospiraceae bacterium]
MEFNKLLKDWQAGKMGHAYLLAGEEPFFIEKLLDLAESKTIPESERDFNQLVLYGKDVNAKYVVETCRQYPLWVLEN